MRELPAHPDAREAIARLLDAGIGVVTLTNSTAEVAEDQLRSAGLRDLIQAVYTADQVQALKPAPGPYRHVLESQHVSPNEAVLVAAHDWDIAGAAAAGLRTAFIARDGQQPLPSSPPPTLTATSLNGAATELIREHHAIENPSAAYPHAANKRSS